MVKRARKVYDDLRLSVNFWMISLAVERAAEKALEREDGLFVDYIL